MNMKSSEGKEWLNGSRFSNYTPLSVVWAKILEETLNADLVSSPKKKLTPHNANGNKHCLYYRNLGQTTEGCSTLRDKIEKLIRVGHLGNSWIRTTWTKIHLVSEA